MSKAQNLHRTNVLLTALTLVTHLAGNLLFSTTRVPASFHSNVNHHPSTWEPLSSTIITPTVTFLDPTPSHRVHPFVKLTNVTRVHPKSTLHIPNAVPASHQCFNVAIIPHTLFQTIIIPPDTLLNDELSDLCICCTSFSGADAQTTCRGLTCQQRLGNIRTSLDEPEPTIPRRDFVKTKRVSPLRKLLMVVRKSFQRILRQVISGFSDFLATLCSDFVWSIAFPAIHMQLLHRLMSLTYIVQYRLARRFTNMGRPTTQASTDTRLQEQARQLQLIRERIISLRARLNNELPEVVEPLDESNDVFAEWMRLERQIDALRAIKGLAPEPRDPGLTTL
ncbi:hypothetical protein FRC02_005476 [Tulasnella sp. 418]|nr:hypothetical protein FRC02_005476 [Tulasnella sp. 418]